MARSKSSDRWLKEHFADAYVKQAQREGFRSRAVYKLKEIQEKDHLLRPGMTVVDLGAAPGGWSQYAAQVSGGRGRIIALDILPMDPLPDVNFLLGDFREEAVFERLLALIDGQAVDLVMSDMAPNISGMGAVDQPRAIYLCELALDLARKVLKPGGDLLMKAFQGQGFDELHADLRRSFERLTVRKPQASRSRSREVYLLARGYKLV